MVQFPAWQRFGNRDDQVEDGRTGSAAVVFNEFMVVLVEDVDPHLAAGGLVVLGKDRR